MLRGSFEEVLIQDKGKLLKAPYKSKWTADNPTYGYCYIVSEVLLHYYLSDDYKSYCINMGDEGVHWFLMNEAGTIVDFTNKQFVVPVNYKEAKRKAFFNGSIPTSKGKISKRGYELYQRVKNLQM